MAVSLRITKELLVARAIALTYETVRRWSVRFGFGIAQRTRSTALLRGDKWHLNEVVVCLNGRKHWLWRAVGQHGAMLDVLAQRRRDRQAAKRLMRKLLMHCRYHTNAQERREARTLAFAAWGREICASMPGGLAA